MAANRPILENAVSMTIGSLRVKMIVRHSSSLKDKRRVVKSLKDQVRNKFNVSVAEVGALNHRQLCVFGVAAVGNNARFVNSCLSKVVDFVRDFHGLELIDYELELF